jgi:soluble lytic murein transglycosylase-like protein
LSKSPCCFSIGFLAFGLTGLVQPPTPSVLDALPAAPVEAQPESQPPAPAQPPPPPAAQPAPAAEVRLPLELGDQGVPEAPFGQLIYKMSGRYKLNPDLVAAVVQVESAFNPRARSRKGARGLMQLLPETARRFGLHRRKDLFNPAKNIEAGVRYLKWLSERFSGNAALVLAAYNAGEGAVERFGGVPPYQETRDYVTRIFGLFGLVPALESPPPPLAAEAIAAGGR